MVEHVFAVVLTLLIGALFGYWARNCDVSREKRRTAYYSELCDHYVQHYTGRLTRLRCAVADIATMDGAFVSTIKARLTEALSVDAKKGGEGPFQ